MRVAGVRISTPYERLLVEIVEKAGFDATAAKLAQAIDLQVTTEVPLTSTDHDAVLAALERHCPAGLYRLHRELDEQRRLRGHVT